jgi:hypothetical protein
LEGVKAEIVPAAIKAVICERGDRCDGEKGEKIELTLVKADFF